MTRPKRLHGVAAHEAAIGMVVDIDIAIDKEVAIAIDLDEVYGIAVLLWSFRML